MSADVLIAVLAASAKFRAHSIVTRRAEREALEFVQALHAAFEAGYRLEFVDLRKRGR